MISLCFVHTVGLPAEILCISLFLNMYSRKQCTAQTTRPVSVLLFVSCPFTSSSCLWTLPKSFVALSNSKGLVYLSVRVCQSMIICQDHKYISWLEKKKNPWHTDSVVALQSHSKKVVASNSPGIMPPLVPLLVFWYSSVCELTVGVCGWLLAWEELVLSKVEHWLHPGTAGKISNWPVTLVVDNGPF